MKNVFILTLACLCIYLYFRAPDNPVVVVVRFWVPASEPSKHDVNEDFKVCADPTVIAKHNVICPAVYFSPKFAKEEGLIR